MGCGRTSTLLRSRQALGTVILKDQVLEVRNVEGRLHTRKEPACLSGSWQRIRQEHLDRVALVEALAAPIRVEITALFKLIELALGHQNWSPKEPVLVAPAISVDRFANLLAAGCHEAAAGFEGCNRLWSVSAYQDVIDYSIDNSPPKGPTHRVRGHTRGCTCWRGARAT